MPTVGESGKKTEILSLIDKINTHPSLDLFLDDESLYHRKPYLTSRPIKKVTADKKASADELSGFVKHLDEVLDKYLITSEGRHSELYWELKDCEDCYIAVLEQDAFGPLICGIFPKPGKWYRTYG